MNEIKNKKLFILNTFGVILMGVSPILGLIGFHITFDSLDLSFPLFTFSFFGGVILLLKTL